MAKTMSSKGKRTDRKWTISINNGKIVAEGTGTTFQEALTAAFKQMAAQDDVDDGSDPRTT